MVLQHRDRLVFTVVIALLVCCYNIVFSIFLHRFPEIPVTSLLEESTVSLINTSVPRNNSIKPSMNMETIVPLEIMRNSNNSLDRKRMRINFLSNTWYHDFVTIQNKLSTYPYISGRSLNAWEESFMGFSGTKIFKDHVIFNHSS